VSVKKKKERFKKGKKLRLLSQEGNQKARGCISFLAIEKKAAKGGRRLGGPTSLEKASKEVGGGKIESGWGGHRSGRDCVCLGKEI